jgi:hypothetical protein
MPTLSTLVAATVFSTTFLTTRVHRESGRAVDRALKLDELLATARRDKEPLDADWFDEQRTVLEGTRYDRLADLVLGMNVVIALAAASLAVAFGVDARTEWDTPQGWGLIAFGGIAVLVLVLVVGAVDVLRVRSVLVRRLSETTMGQLAVADRALRRLGAKKISDRKMAAARAAAARAVQTSRGLYGPAHAWRARVELLSLAAPTAPDHLLKASRWLDRAIEAGPPTAATYAAKACVHESFGVDEQEDGNPDRAAAEFGLATDAWCHAVELYFRARQDDEETLDPRMRERMTGDRGGLYGWLHRPRRPEPLAAALDRLPTGTGPALITARLLAQAAGKYPESEDVAVRALRGWLDRLLHDFGGVAAQRAIREVLETSTYEPARELAQQVVAEAEEGVQRAIDDLDRLQESVVEQQRDLDQMAVRSGESAEARSREESARLARLENGQATAEDLAWEQRMIAETVDLASSPETPAVLEREVRDMQEGEARAEARRRRSEERRRAVAEQAQVAAAMARRLQRRRAGRATEADLAEEGRLTYELRDRSKDGDQ